MKIICLLILLIVESAVVSATKPRAKPAFHADARNLLGLDSAKDAVYNFACGFFEGFRVQGDFSTLKNCMQNADGIWKDLKETVGHFNSLSYVWGHFGDLMGHIALPLTQLMGDLTPCITAGSFVSQAAELAMLLSPQLLTLHTLEAAVIHTPYLVRQIADMYYAVADQDAHRLGLDIGNFWFTLLFNR